MIVVAKTIPSLKTREEQLKVNKHPMRSISSISNRTLVPSIQTLKQTYNKSDRQKDKKNTKNAIPLKNSPEVWFRWICKHEFLSVDDGTRWLWIAFKRLSTGDDSIKTVYLFSIPNDSINYIAKSVQNFHLLELLGINLCL